MLRTAALGANSNLARGWPASAAISAAGARPRISILSLWQVDHGLIEMKVAQVHA